jgi:hypothetical protein
MNDKEFCDLQWHEAKLLSICLGSRDFAQQSFIVLEVRLDNGQSKRIKFLGCTWVMLKCDLDYMRVLGDAVNNATVESAESLKNVVTDVKDTSPCRKYTIDFIPPGGTIEVFATSVVIEEI